MAGFEGSPCATVAPGAAPKPDGSGVVGGICWSPSGSIEVGSKPPVCSMSIAARAATVSAKLTGCAMSALLAGVSVGPPAWAGVAGSAAAVAAAAGGSPPGSR